MLKRRQLIDLREDIYDCTVRAREIARRIRAAKGRERHDLWNEKRRVGVTARWLLALYAFARGVPYRAIEPAGSSTLHAPALGQMAFERYGLEIGKTAPQLAELAQAWLTAPETEAMRARRAQAKAAWQARRRARAAEHAA